MLLIIARWMGLNIPELSRKLARDAAFSFEKLDAPLA